MPNKKTREEYIKHVNKVHNNFYDYSIFEYLGSKIKGSIKCPKHGVFVQRADLHSLGSGCPKCSLSSKVSKAEIEVFEFVKTLTKENVLQSDRQLIKPKELDIYIPDLNIAIEFNGKYWHSDKFKDKNHRKVKTLLCNKKCVKLFHIEEEDWKNYKNMTKDKIKNLINNAKVNV